MPSDSRPRRSRSLVWAPSPCPSPPPRLMGCVVRFVATRASRGLGVDWRGLGVSWRARVGGWVGFEGVRFVRFVCLSRVCPGSPRCLFTGIVHEFHETASRACGSHVQWSPPRTELTTFPQQTSHSAVQIRRSRNGHLIQYPSPDQFFGAGCLRIP